MWCWSVAGPNCKKVEEVDLSYLECGDIKCTWCVARGVSIYIGLPLSLYNRPQCDFKMEERGAVQNHSLLRLLYQ